MTSDPAELRTHVQSGLGNAYTLERELSGGGMARVFLANETALGRRVVVKVLAPELAEGLSAERFAREVRLAARLQHPNILPVFTAGAAGGAQYYTMPFVEGESLRVRLDREGLLSTTDAIGILRDLARALAHAHDHGVVHRDVKPDNILLSQDTAVVADFGIAKAVDAARAAPSGIALTQLGMTIGTPAYMAPEQAVGDPEVDQRADLYAWGVVAYELLAGRHPFAEKATAQAFVVAHLVEEPTPLDAARPGLSSSLVALVTRCLAKSPTDRPASARELVDVLANLSSFDAAKPIPVPPALPSVAILPFVNLSADPENEYFSDGITEEVLSVLAQDTGLRVAARTSSFMFKGKQVELRAIADQLHVATVLEGSVRRVGNRVRITAPLVNGVDGNHLWSERFDRELTDIFAVQDEIASAIAATLRRRLREAAGAGSSSSDPGVRPAPRTRHPVSVEAYDAYLKGLHVNRSRRGAGQAGALAHFERAVSLDPGFAAAHAGLGETHMWLNFGDAIPPSEGFARARRHARRALALDAELPDAHWVLGEVAFWHDWDADAAEEHLRAVLAREPRHPRAHMSLALIHSSRLRRKEALASGATAVEADPLDLGTRVWLAAVAVNVGEIDLSLTETTRLIIEHPDFPAGYRWRAVARLLTGDFAGSLADHEAADRLVPPNSWGRAMRAILASQAGDLVEVHRIRDELHRQATREWVSPLMLGLVEAALGNDDEAFECFERGYQARENLLTVLHTDRSFQLVPPGKDRAITDDPRWANLVRRIGLAPSA